MIPSSFTIKEAINAGYQTCQCSEGRIYGLDSLDPDNIPRNKYFVNVTKKKVLLDNIKDKYFFDPLGDIFDDGADYIIGSLPDEIWSKFIKNINEWLSKNPLVKTEVYRVYIVSRRL